MTNTDPMRLAILEQSRADRRLHRFLYGYRWHYPTTPPPEAAQPLVTVEVHVHMHITLHVEDG
jgi:hypothetical protein